MSVWEKFKVWFWGDLKEESKSEPVEKPKKKRAPRKPKVPETTDEFLEKEVKKRAPRKRTPKKPAEKPATKKPRKPRKKKESNAD